MKLDAEDITETHRRVPGRLDLPQAGPADMG